MPTTERPHHLYAEATLRVSRHPVLSAWRKALTGTPLPLHEAHVIAEATVFSRDVPVLTLTADESGVITGLFTWPGKEGGDVIKSLSVRERGGRPLPRTEDHAFNAEQRAQVAQAVADGQLTPNLARRVLAGGVTMEAALAQGQATGPLAVALPARVAAMFSEGVVGPFSTDALPPPSESTSVLHDLRFIAEALETAQFQVAMSPGGADAGSVQNEAHVALLAVQLVQAKLEVVTDAADMAAESLNGALARLEAQSVGETGAKRKLNSARDMVAIITRRLPKPETPADVRF